MADEEEALTMSSRIAVMNEGRVEQMGTALEIYDNPANRFVADFVGETNLFRAEIVPVEEDIVHMPVPVFAAFGQIQRDGLDRRKDSSCCTAGKGCVCSKRRWRALLL